MTLRELHQVSMYLQMPEDIQWSLEDLKKSILDSAEEYDRLLKNGEPNDITTFTRMGSEQTETETPSKE